MDIFVSKDNLLESISFAQKAVSNKSSNPIIEGILLSVTDKITLTGFDLETGIEVTLSGDIKETGRLVVPSKVFGEIVRNLASDEVVLQSDERNYLTITCGESKFELKCSSGDAYPLLTVIEDAEEISLPQNIFRDMLKQTLFAVSKDQARPIFTGVNIKTSGKQLLVAAIDGFRMAIRSEDLQCDLPEMTIIVPSKALAEVSRIVGDADDNISLCKSHNNIVFSTKNIKIVTRLIKGDYYNFFNSIPTSTESYIKCDREQLYNAINRASVVITDENQYSVTLRQESENLLIIEAITEIGTAREQVAIVSEGNFIDYDYRPRFLMESLKAIEDEEVHISIGQKHNSCVMTTGSINDKEAGIIDKFVYLVLPLMRRS